MLCTNNGVRSIVTSPRAGEVGGVCRRKRVCAGEPAPVAISILVTALLHKIKSSILPPRPTFTRITFTMTLKRRLPAHCTRRCLFIFMVCASVNSVRGDEYTETPGTEGNGNVSIGPEYKVDPDLTDRGNPKGKSFEFTMRLADSKIFPGKAVSVGDTSSVRIRP